MWPLCPLREMAPASRGAKRALLKPCRRGWGTPVHHHNVTTGLVAREFGGCGVGKLVVWSWRGDEDRLAPWPW